MVTMVTLTPESCLDKLAINPEPDPQEWYLLTRIDAPEELLPITVIIRSITPSRLPSFVSGVWERTAYNLDEIGFHYSVESEMDPEEEPFGRSSSQRGRNGSKNPTENSFPRPQNRKIKINLSPDFSRGTRKAP